MRTRSAVRVSLKKDAHTVNAEPRRRNLIILSQGFGSAFIWYWSGSGSSILDWIPIRIRIQSGFRVFMTKNLKKFTADKIFFGSKTTIYRTSKVQKKPSARQREHPALQNMKFLNFFSTFVGHFCPAGSEFRIRIRIRKFNSCFIPSGWGGVQWGYPEPHAGHAWGHEEEAEPGRNPHEGSAADPDPVTIFNFNGSWVHF